jgi:hypothetical protein
MRFISGNASFRYINKLSLVKKIYSAAVKKKYISLEPSKLAHAVGF